MTPLSRSRLRAVFQAFCGLAAFGGMGVGNSDYLPARAWAQEQAAPADGRQVTVLAILATPGTKDLDQRLASVGPQLRKVMPNHGFRLMEVQSKRLRPGQSIAFKLGNGYKAQTTLEDASDDSGKVLFRCEFRKGGEVQFSKSIRSPENQLFFYERKLDDGKRVLIGVGARPGLD